MTYSTTRTSTFSITEARYVASKLGADLRNLYSRYGRPLESDIADFIEETALYLKAGYLDYVDFGFKSGTEWKLRLRYTAVAGGQLRDDGPGGLPSAVDVASYEFFTFLNRNSAFANLTSSDKSTFELTLPVSRTPGSAPTAHAGSHSTGAQYSRGGHGLDRGIYRAI